MNDLRLGGTQRMILARVRGIPGCEHHVWAPARIAPGHATDIEDAMCAAWGAVYAELVGAP